LPPEARLLLAIGLSSWVDDYYDIGPSHYRFVENRNFGARRLNSVFIDQSRNVSIINQTTNITNITYVNNVVYNGGPVYDQQLRQSREPIQRYRLDRRQDFDGNSRRQSPENLRSRFEGDSMSVLALPFTGRAATAPRQLAERVEHAEVNHGWRNAGTPDEIATMRERMKSKEKAPDRLPPPTTFVKVTDEAAVREERRPDERPTMPGERPSKSKGNSNDKPGRPNMPPSATEPTRPGARPPIPTDAPKDKGTDKPMRPDMPPGFPERLIRPGERPPADVPKGKGADRPSRPDMPPTVTEKPMRPGDRPPTPANAPKGDKPDRPAMPLTTTEKPNRGGRNKVETPQLPRTENRPPAAAVPKARERLPQIMPPKRRPAPDRPKVEMPKIAPGKPVPSPKPPQAAPSRPSKERGNLKPDDRKKKKDD
jgi:hypothetical protein